MSRKQAKDSKKAQKPREIIISESMKSELEAKQKADSTSITPTNKKNNEEIPENQNDIEFDIKFRGYDCVQVEHYINALTENYNAICRECEALRKENRGIRNALTTLGEILSGDSL